MNPLRHNDKSAQTWWATGLVLACVMGSAPAPAQGTAPPPTAIASAGDQEGEADRLYKAGVEAAKVKQWAQARELILKSFELAPTAAKAANLGRVELAAERPRDAAEHLVYFLREAQGITDDDRRSTEKMLGEAETKIGTVTIQAEAGAELSVDGRRVGKAPLADPVFVDAGTRHFEAKKTGATASQDVQVVAGSAPVVELKFAGTGGIGSAIPAGVASRGSANAHVGAGTTGSDKGAGTPSDTTGTRHKTLTYVGIGLSSGLAALGIATGIGAVLANRAEFHNWNTHGCPKATVATPTGPIWTDAQCRHDVDIKEDQRFYLGNIAGWSLASAIAIGSLTAVYALKFEKPTSRRTSKIIFSVSPQNHWFMMSGNF